LSLIRASIVGILEASGLLNRDPVHLGKWRANLQLVTFKGRGFDLPVPIHRSIKHGVAEGRELLMEAANESR
jgi:hypothetical protein